MRATIIVRPFPAIRFDAFAAGFEALGYKVDTRPSRRYQPQPDDVLLIWNHSPASDQFVRTYRQAGAKIIVAENGYLGREWRGGVWYALALDHHNGAGSWRYSDKEVQALGKERSDPQLAHRWDSWGVDLAPWREDGGDIVILAQRGIGELGVREPPGWHRQALRALQGRTKRKVRIRRHPGENNRCTPLCDDLAGAWACVTWGSAAALKAMMMGIPVFHGFPQWIGGPAALPWGGDIEAPFRGDRLPMFRRLAYAQWDLQEIQSGEAFAKLIGEAEPCIGCSP